MATDGASPRTSSAPSCARRTPSSSRGRPGTPTTSRARACCTWRRPQPVRPRHDQRRRPRRRRSRWTASWRRSPAPTWPATGPGRSSWPGRSREDIKNPPHWPLAEGQGPPSGRRRRRRGRRVARPRPRTPPRPSRSTTSRCRWSSTWRPRSPTARRWSTRVRHEPLLHVDAHDRRRRQGVRRRAPVVVKERYVHPAADPERHRAARGPGRSPTSATGEFTMWSSTQIPHIAAGGDGAGHCGIPESKLRIIAPGVGGGFGSKLQVYAEEALALVLAEEARPADQVDRGALGELPGHPPRPRPDPGDRAGGRRATARSAGYRVKILAEHGGLPADHHARDAALGAFLYCGCYGGEAYYVRVAPACSRTPRRPTPTAARADPRPRTPSSGPSTRSPARSARTRWRSAA